MHQRGATVQLLHLTAQNQAHRQALQARTHYVELSSIRNRAANSVLQIPTPCTAHRQALQAAAHHD